MCGGSSAGRKSWKRSTAKWSAACRPPCLLGDNNPQAHIVKANFVWDMPDVQGSTPAMRTLGAIANGRQLAGIWTASTGSAYAIGYGYNNGGGNVNLTGSPDYGGRIVGDTGSGCSSDPYRQFNGAAFRF